MKKVSISLGEVDKLNRNNRIYPKEVIQKYLSESKEQLESNRVPLMLPDYLGDRHNDKIIGGGTLYLDNNELLFDGCMSDAYLTVDAINKLFAVIRCEADIAEDGVSIENITPYSMSVNIANSSAFTFEPNIKIEK